LLKQKGETVKFHSNWCDVAENIKNVAMTTFPKKINQPSTLTVYINGVRVEFAEQVYK